MASTWLSVCGPSAVCPDPSGSVPKRRSRVPSALSGLRAEGDSAFEAQTRGSRTFVCTLRIHNRHILAKYLSEHASSARSCLWIMPKSSFCTLYNVRNNGLWTLESFFWGFFYSRWTVNALY